jgi:hypothetical protein
MPFAISNQQKRVADIAGCQTRVEKCMNNAVLVMFAEMGNSGSFGSLSR